MKLSSSLFLLLSLSIGACAPMDNATLPTERIAPAPSQIADQLQPITEGWRETVISVTDINEWQSFYQNTLGWEVRSKGAVPREVLSAWQLPDHAEANYVLMANPGTTRGYVRIMNFDHVDQVRIRHHAQAWETGGIYNMNIRVPSVAAVEQVVTDAGWQAPSAPVNFVFGPFDVWEWIPRHKDGVRIAFAQRVKPVLTGWPHMRTSSRAFNSTQIVKDMAAAMHFYQDVLGFKTYLEHQGASSAAQDHVLGLSHQAMTSVIRDVRILSPSGENDGSVELLLFEDYSGRDFSERAVPPNLGNLMLRYPVTDSARLLQRISDAGIALEYEPLEIQLPPYGQVKLFAVRAPDGAWIEFFEPMRK